MVPEGRNTAASLPNRPATRSCKALVVGSSAFCSSPTSAPAIILRMPEEGRVEVSLDRSTNAFDVIVNAPANFRHGTCSDCQGQEGVQERPMDSSALQVAVALRQNYLAGASCALLAHSNNLIARQKNRGNRRTAISGISWKP